MERSPPTGICTPAKLLAALSATAIMVATGAVLAGQRAASDAEIDAIRAALETRLADAQSARFSHAMVDDDGNMCGLLNAKNRMGAYVGYQPFTGMIFDLDGKKVAAPMGIDSPEATRSLCAEKGFLLPP